jgi:hypothetical protein
MNRMPPIWLQKLLFGRPMLETGYRFKDLVSGREVLQFIDCWGRLWMAHSRWGAGRVRHAETTMQGDACQK